MKFVVTKHPLNEVDVRLPWETRSKIRKGLYSIAVMPAAVFVLLYVVTKKKTEPSE